MRSESNLFKLIIRVFCFCTVLAIVLIDVFQILWLWDDSYAVSSMRGFYKLPKNSLDAVYIGSSGVKEFYIAPEGFVRSGIAVYPIASSMQPSMAIPYLMDEVRKTQDPKLYLIDIRELVNEGPLWDNSIRMTTDTMKFSMNRIHLIDRLLAIYAEEQPDKEFSKWDYYFSFTTYHSRWEDLREDDFTGGPVWLGYTIFDNIQDTDKPHWSRTADHFDPAPLDGHREQALNDILNYCKDLDAKVIFTCTPALWTDQELARLATVQSTVIDAGYTVWDLSRPEVTDQMQLDYSIDMNNDNHVNVYGAIKFTEYLSYVLREMHDLPDHRGDPAYKFWEDEDKSFREALIATTEDEEQFAFLKEKGILGE